MRVDVGTRGGGQGREGGQDRGYEVGFSALGVAHSRVSPGLYKLDIRKDLSYALVHRSATRYFLPQATDSMRMGLDDSKYLLQLARADVLTLPESPGDWDSVTVKSPKQGIIYSHLTSLENISISRTWPTHDSLQAVQPPDKIPPRAPQCHPTPPAIPLAQAPPPDPRDPRKQHNTPPPRRKRHHHHRRGRITLSPHQARQGGRLRGQRARQRIKGGENTAWRSCRLFSLVSGRIPLSRRPRMST